MDKKIIKVVFDDQTELTVGEHKTIEQIKAEYTYDKDWKVNRHYQRQFQTIERDILWNLDDDTVKDYAKDHLDLVEQDDCDCDCKEKDISDFEDNEIMAELSSRKILGQTNTNIITIDLFTRFSKVLNFADTQELDKIITELELKYKL